MTAFEKARTFVYRNARPLDLAIWQYHFENGSKEAVMHALSAYQNSDGGFGHGLEADNFNPNSAPMQTWKAANIIDGIGFEGEHPVISGMLRFLKSGADFDNDKRQWLNTVPSNNDYPHAIWWEYNENSLFNYNPTAALAAFIFLHTPKNSPLYNKAIDLTGEALEYYYSPDTEPEQHVTSCYIELYNALKKADITAFDLDKLRSAISSNMDKLICRDTSKWGKEYVSLPSTFISGADSEFILGYEDLCLAECELIKNNQLPDGSYNVPWQWCTPYKEFTLAENWWKSIITTNNMLFLRNMNKL